jgi:hypothetical protein
MNKLKVLVLCFPYFTNNFINSKIYIYIINKNIIFIYTPLTMRFET